MSSDMHICDSSPRYRPGALWVTRANLVAHIINPEGATILAAIPPKEIICLLSYVMDLDFRENITFLWKEKKYTVSNIDAGLNFDTNPGGINANAFQK